MKMSSTPSKPWYREPWPWLLMSGPAIVVVAGVFTAYLAISSQDGLVVDDYYKQGLAVNQDLSRDRATFSAALSAVATLDASQGRVTLNLINAPSDTDEIRITLSRATVSGHDQKIALHRTGRVHNEIHFVGVIAPLAIGKWYVTIDDATLSWRLLSTITVQNKAPITFSVGVANSSVELKLAGG